MKRTKKLFILRYHKFAVQKLSSDYEKVFQQLLYLKNFPSLLPGDPLEEKTSYLLTFDDATYDFYHYIFPYLQKFSLKALLAVAPRYIVDESPLSSKERLDIPYYLAMQDGIFDTRAPFCTWKELNEMVSSGLVQIASHSFSHPNLTFPFVKVKTEVDKAKKRLEERLPQAITSFIYPFGRCTEAVDRLVRKEHAYRFGAEQGVEHGWTVERPLLRNLNPGLTRANKKY